MKFSLFTDYGALNSKLVFEAFETSLLDNGHTVVHNSLDADVAVIWSVLWNGRMAQNKKVWEHFHSQNKDVVVLEIGGLRRGYTWKVGLNGINRDAYFGPDNNDNSRVKLLDLTLKSWRKNGDYILICGQHEKSHQWHNMPRMSAWVMSTIETLQKHSKRSIIFRPHPRCPLPDIEKQYRNVYRQHPQHVTGSYDDFDLGYDNAWAVVNWSSNPGVEAVRAGIPAFVGPSSLAWPVASHNLADIENPNMPVREQWLNDLAYSEYTVNEIKDGLPLKRLTDKLECVNLTT